MYEIKTKDVYQGFNKVKKLFNFKNYSARSKYYDDSSTLFVGRMEDETAGTAIEEFVGLKQKIYSFLVDDSMSIKK